MRSRSSVRARAAVSSSRLAPVRFSGNCGVVARIRSACEMRFLGCRVSRFDFMPSRYERRYLESKRSLLSINADFRHYRDDRACTGQELSCYTALMLAPYAVRAEDSRGRRYPEPPHPYRNPFQRDRDRVIHARAFRRLENKTQVFTRRYSDHFRTRLTHTMEVAQISRTIAGGARSECRSGGSAGAGA